MFYDRDRPLETPLMMITEPAASFFSFVHIPVIFYLFQHTFSVQRTLVKRPGVPDSPFIWPYRFVLLQGMLTWLLSTVYHAYHTTFTEHLDYYGAAGLLMTYLYTALLRASNATEPEWQLIIGSIFLSWFIGHCYFMEFIDFHYQYNMWFCTIIVLLKFLLWIFITWERDGRSHPGMKQLYWLIGSMGAISLLETYDFPPIWDTFDAHSIWHALTPIWTYYWTMFMITDLRFFQKSSTTTQD